MTGRLMDSHEVCMLCTGEADTVLMPYMVYIITGVLQVHMLAMIGTEYAVGTLILYTMLVECCSHEVWASRGISILWISHLHDGDRIHIAILTGCTGCLLLILIAIMSTVVVYSRYYMCYEIGVMACTPSLTMT